LAKHILQVRIRRRILNCISKVLNDTTESIADHNRRPLLKISSAELQGPAYQVEGQLSRLFSLSTRWKSIMLMDEADVFMQERTLDNLEVNWLVSSESSISFLLE
jgi:hypothetical protein